MQKTSKSERKTLHYPHQQPSTALGGGGGGSRMIMMKGSAL
jgi:hypothetical protein